VGNGISFVILSFDQSLAGRQNITRVYDYTVCGANDCQIANVTHTSLAQYQPAYPSTRFVLTGLFCLLCMVSIVLYILYLPNDINWPTDIINETSSKPGVDDGSEVKVEETCQSDCEKSPSATFMNDKSAEVLLVSEDGRPMCKSNADNDVAPSSTRKVFDAILTIIE